MILLECGGVHHFPTFPYNLVRTYKPLTSFYSLGSTKMQFFIYRWRISPSRLAAQGLWPRRCFDCGDPDVQTASAGRRGPSAGLHSRYMNYQTHAGLLTHFHYVPYILNTSLHGGFTPLSVLTLLIYILVYILHVIADILHIKTFVGTCAASICSTWGNCALHSCT